MGTRARALVLVASAVILAGILFGAVGRSGRSGIKRPVSPAPARSMTIASPAFARSSAIPEPFTCDGGNTSPELVFSGVPAGTRSLALIMDDPDAPSGTFTHWLLWDIPPDASGIPEGNGNIGVRGTTSFGRAEYGGPCPPRGGPHRYFFKLYALDRDLALPAGASRAEMEFSMKDHIIAETELMGTYER